ncbi:hypothetical protein [Cupriavidus sp. D384]|uniref:hypothetical protein n=1 Tax=Cupriavidus sp. D384 TaxID=1538095 RepID=UPI0008350C7E|nr:hypothetical protein [Cupriavidus sp. D384]
MKVFDDSHIPEDQKLIQEYEYDIQNPAYFLDDGQAAPQEKLMSAPEAADIKAAAKRIAMALYGDVRQVDCDIIESHIHDLLFQRCAEG